MFWLFSCMYILFLGAEVSMWLEHSGIAADLKNLEKKRRKRRRHKPDRKPPPTSSKKE